MSRSYLQLAFSAFMKKLTCTHPNRSCGSIILHCVNMKYSTLFQLDKLYFSKMQFPFWSKLSERVQGTMIINFFFWSQWLSKIFLKLDHNFPSPRLTSLVQFTPSPVSKRLHLSPLCHPQSVSIWHKHRIILLNHLKPSIFHTKLSSDIPPYS